MGLGVVGSGAERVMGLEVVRGRGFRHFGV